MSKESPVTLQELMDLISVPSLRYLSTRYPSTYARDFVRAHILEIVPVCVLQEVTASYSGFAAVGCSRSDASLVIRAWAQYEGYTEHTMYTMLAEAYLQEHHLVKP